MSGIEAGIGTDVIVWLQSWGQPFLSYLLYPFHFAGSEYGYLLLLPIVYWAASKRHGRRLMILALSANLVGQYLKFLIRRPRPFQVSPDRVDAFIEEGGFGIPSNHTVSGTVVAGYVWYNARRKWPVILAVVLAVVMGFSRMIHGVHFPQDVLAGWVLGILVTVLFAFCDRRYSRAIEGWSVGTSISAIAVMAVAAFVFSLLVEHEFEERKVLFSLVGGLAGGLSGFVLEGRKICFSVAGGAWRRILRTLLGLVTTAACYFLVDLLYDAVAGGTTGLGAMILYVLKYGLVAFWVAAGAPWLFLLTRLADRE